MQNNQPTNRSKKLITASSIAGVVIAGAVAVGATLGLPTAGAQPSEAVPTTSAATPDGATQTVEAFAVEDAGIVTVQRDGDALILVSVDPTDGWSFDSEVEDDEVEVEFAGPDGTELEFEAELRDGAIEVYIEAEGDEAGDYEAGGYEDHDDHDEYEDHDDDDEDDDYEDDDHENDEDHG